MARADLQSHTLKTAIYQDRSASLELAFRSGAIYRYRDVPEPVFQELLRAESKGRYFNQRIRNRFPHAKIDPVHKGPTRASTLHKGAG